MFGRAWDAFKSNNMERTNYVNNVKTQQKKIRDLTIECIKGALTPHQLRCIEAEYGKLETLDDKILAGILDSLNDNKPTK